MARGWESKSVESQQESARQGSARRPAMTDEERRLAARRQTLELALASARAELQAASQPAHREMLRLKVDALQAALATS